MSADDIERKEHDLLELKNKEHNTTSTNGNTALINEGIK